jgi:hypothetical protein
MDCEKISQETGIIYRKIRKAFLRSNTPILSHSYNKSKGELEVRDYINYLGEDCVSKKLKYMDKCMEIDCLVVSHNFGIEYCGEYWHSELHKSKNYHKFKTFWAKEQGIKLFTIFEYEWNNKKDILKSMINNALQKNIEKIYARKCQIREIPSKEIKHFYNINHLQGERNATHNIVLIYDNEIVAGMSFSKPRSNKKYEWEIYRFCNKLNINVVGGATKLFKYFINKYSPKSIISYADFRYSYGDLYKKLGMFELNLTEPNYYYFNKSKLLLESRIKYQKHKLEKKLKIFDKNLSESENMKNNGYIRIYDSGNLVYIYNMKNNK